jgi:hypothetical protein
MLRRGMTTQQHLAQHDKQIGAIRDLVRDGMKLVIETRKDMREMLKAQKRTEKNLAELIAALGRSTNGKH